MNMLSISVDKFLCTHVGLSMLGIIEQFCKVISMKSLKDQY